MSLFKVLVIISPLLKAKSTFRNLQKDWQDKYHAIKILRNITCKPSKNFGTTLCRNQPSGKFSNISSNNGNYINNNISRNKVNDNISNNKISNNNINFDTSNN